MTIQCILLQIEQQMSCCRAVCHHLPDCRFHQIDRKLVDKSADHLADWGHFSPRPDGVYSLGNVSKGGKRFAPDMQKDQIVVATFRQGTLSANPEGALLQAGKPSCGLGFDQVPISPFVILHACLSNERCSVGQRAYDIGQVMMGGVLKRVANGKRGMLWDRQSILRGKLRANIATCVTGNERVIFEPQKKTFFELTTKRLSDDRARFVARNPS